jgi:hypothetical protein
VGRGPPDLDAGIPVGRAGNLHDVADLITCLCRAESGYISGATYDLNGGAHSLTAAPVRRDAGLRQHDSRVRASRWC